MINNCTNINKTIISHLKSLNIEKTTTYDIENLSPGLGQALKCGRVYWRSLNVNLSPKYFFVGGLISYLRDLCVFAYSGVQHILCCVFDLFFFILCTLCCQCFWIILFDCPFGVLLLFRIRVRYRILKLRVYE
jgi:hypothetical protein